MTHPIIRPISDTLLGCLLAALGLGAVACGGDATTEIVAPNYQDQPLQGTVDGRAWEYTYARVTDPPGDGRRLELYPDEEPPDDPCAVGPGAEWSIQVGLPTVEEGRRDFNREYPAYFTDTIEQVTTTAGWFEFTSVNTFEVQAQLVAKYSDQFVVNGHFTATRCDTQNVDL